MRAALVTSLLAGLGVAQTLVETNSLVSTRRLTKRDSPEDFNITFFHVNDIHAHLDQYEPGGTNCTDPSKGCLGGIARLKKAIDTRRDMNNSLWLDAGDEFQGTMYWSYYHSQKIADAVKILNFDAMTLGNHEFDAGDDELARFIGNITFPVISANIVSDHPVLNKSIVPYKIFWEHGVAVVGATTPTTKTTSSPGAGTNFLDVVSSVQHAVDEILSTTNITRVVALTHIGYEEDIQLAQKTSGLSLIMGGHSHTLLGSMKGASGPYPTITKNKDGHEVFVVQAYRWGEYLGYINVAYDSQGVTAYSGGPIHMDSTQPMDEEVEAKVRAWAEPFEAFSAQVVGQTDVDLDATACQSGDCLLGEVMADAMMAYRRGQVPDIFRSSAPASATSATSSPRPSPTMSPGSDASPDFALINAGGVRATIPAGPVTRGDILTAFPFGNAVVQLTFSGSELRNILEGAVSGFNSETKVNTTSWFQVSHDIKIQYNPDSPVGSKLVSVEIGGVALDSNRDYHVVTVDYLASGGDSILPKQTGFAPLEMLNDVLTNYINANSPIKAVLEQRVANTTETAPSDEPPSDGSHRPRVAVVAGVPAQMVLAFMVAILVLCV